MPKRTLEVSDETWAQIKQIAAKDAEAVAIGQLSDLVGECWFFRTVTYHIIGRVTVMHNSNILQLEQACWVADSGRFMQAIQNGTLKEVEPLGQWFVNLATVTDFGPWRHALPLDQK